MNRNRLIRSCVTVGICLFLVLMFDRYSSAQSPASRPPVIARVDIPYDFWIAGDRLPAGHYAVSRVLATVLLFRNAQADRQEQVFLVPTGQPLSAGNDRLIFVVHSGQRYLREVWNSDGRQVVTDQLGLPLAPGDTFVELRLAQ